MWRADDAFTHVSLRRKISIRTGYLKIQTKLFILGEIQKNPADVPGHTPPVLRVGTGPPLTWAAPSNRAAKSGVVTSQPHCITSEATFSLCRSDFPAPVGGVNYGCARRAAACR